MHFIISQWTQKQRAKQKQKSIANTLSLSTKCPKTATCTMGMSLKCDDLNEFKIRNGPKDTDFYFLAKTD